MTHVTQVWAPPKGLRPISVRCYMLMGKQWIELEYAGGRYRLQRCLEDDDVQEVAAL